MLCFSKNNTGALSVAPVRYPVVQISFKLHIMQQKEEHEQCKGKRQKNYSLTHHAGLKSSTQNPVILQQKPIESRFLTKTPQCSLGFLKPLPATI